MDKLMREAFEEWFEPSGKGLDRGADGNYTFMTAHSAWQAFQAGYKAKSREF